MSRISAPSSLSIDSASSAGSALSDLPAETVKSPSPEALEMDIGVLEPPFELMDNENVDRLEYQYTQRRA
jgi:hypothetical protein